MKLAEPRKVTTFDIGDHVKYAHPAWPSYDVVGVIRGTYHNDRHVVVTDSGREWALWTKYLTLMSEVPDEDR